MTLIQILRNILKDFCSDFFTLTSSDKVAIKEKSSDKSAINSEIGDKTAINSEIGDKTAINSEIGDKSAINQKSSMKTKKVHQKVHQKPLTRTKRNKFAVSFQTNSSRKV